MAARSGSSEPLWLFHVNLLIHLQRVHYCKLSDSLNGHRFLTTLVFIYIYIYIFFLQRLRWFTLKDDVPLWGIMNNRFQRCFRCPLFLSGANNNVALFYQRPEETNTPQFLKYDRGMTSRMNECGHRDNYYIKILRGFSFKANICKLCLCANTGGTFSSKGKRESFPVQGALCSHGEDILIRGERAYDWFVMPRKKR